MADSFTDSRQFTNTLMNRVVKYRLSIGKFIICALAALFCSILASNAFELTASQSNMVGIFVFAALLWATETTPLYSTSLIVLCLEMIFIANPGGWGFLDLDMQNAPKYAEILQSVADPVLLLFFGGMTLAAASAKQGVDVKLAYFILKKFGKSPQSILFGMMAVTAFLSMWMSNTATTAMMITIALPLLKQIPKGDPLKKALILSIPFSANIGGMGTPIGTPPNAVALSILGRYGSTIGFVEWMVIAVPVMLVIHAFAWAILMLFFPTGKRDLKLNIRRKDGGLRGFLVEVIFAVTVLLWVTEKVHGIPSAIVALLPAVVFTATGVLKRDDINRMDWNILILIAGGIALGAGFSLTHLDQAIINRVPVSGPLAIIAFVLAAYGLSTVMSHTAASNLIIPIAVSFAAANTQAISPHAIALSVALASSAAMALPISTPPNAMAYATGEIRTKDMLKAGIAVGAVSLAIFMLVASFLMG